MSLRDRLKRAVRAFVSGDDDASREVRIEVVASHEEPVSASEASDCHQSIEPEMQTVDMPTWLYVRLPMSGHVYELPLPKGAQFFAMPKGSRLDGDSYGVVWCEPDGEEWH